MKGADKLLHLKVDIGETRAAHDRCRHREGLQAGATGRPQSGDRGEPRAAKASRHRVARHDRGGVTARRAARAGGFPRRHRAGRSVEVRLVDSHSHLDDQRFGDDRDAGGSARPRRGRHTHAFDRHRRRSARPGGGDPAGRQIRAGVCDRGIHPEHAPKVTQADYDRLAELLRHPKVLLLGEIGLDYYWKPYDAKLQAEVFVQQMQIAAAARKPISIHTRDAWDDTIGLLR